MAYPVSFEVDYVERRSRLTVFFRAILAIPVFIWIWLYGVLLWLATVVAWFAIVLTGRFPAGLYTFCSGGLRVITRGTSYVALLCDEYPPFGPGDAADYPVRMHFERLPRYSRLKTLFRVILEIPILVLRYALNVVLEVATVAAWITIVVIGRMPRGLFDLMVIVNSYVARSDAYLFLLTETYPPFQDATTRAAGFPDSA